MLDKSEDGFNREQSARGSAFRADRLTSADRPTTIFDTHGRWLKPMRYHVELSDHFQLPLFADVCGFLHCILETVFKPLAMEADQRTQGNASQKLRHNCKYFASMPEQYTITALVRDVEKPSASSVSPSDTILNGAEITYPEGGRDAWLVVLGACCSLMASLGIYNTAGVFEVVVAQSILPNDSPSTLGWIFSIYAFVVWICGVQIGPTFDATGPRALMIAGTVCTFGGILALSFCTGDMSLVTHFLVRH
nr:putative transporter mch4 [Quercus suber]